MPITSNVAATLLLMCKFENRCTLKVGNKHTHSLHSFKSMPTFLQEVTRKISHGITRPVWCRKFLTTDADTVKRGKRRDG